MYQQSSEQESLSPFELITLELSKKETADKQLRLQWKKIINDIQAQLFAVDLTEAGSYRNVLNCLLAAAIQRSSVADLSKSLTNFHECLVNYAYTTDPDDIQSVTANLGIFLQAIGISIPSQVFSTSSEADTVSHGDLRDGKLPEKVASDKQLFDEIKAPREETETIVKGEPKLTLEKAAKKKDQTMDFNVMLKSGLVIASEDAGKVQRSKLDNQKDVNVLSTMTLRLIANATRNKRKFSVPFNSIGKQPGIRLNFSQKYYYSVYTGRMNYYDNFIADLKFVLGSILHKSSNPDLDPEHSHFMKRMNNMLYIKAESSVINLISDIHDHLIQSTPQSELYVTLSTFYLILVQFVYDYYPNPGPENLASAEYTILVILDLAKEFPELREVIKHFYNYKFCQSEVLSLSNASSSDTLVGQGEVGAQEIEMVDLGGGDEADEVLRISTSAQVIQEVATPPEAPPGSPTAT